MPIMRGIIQTVLGNGQEGFGGDGGPALQRPAKHPICAPSTPMAICSCVWDNTTVSGAWTPTPASSRWSLARGERVQRRWRPCPPATFNMPYALTVDANGDIYVAERGNPIVRKIDGKTGLITTLAGTGEKGYSGDGGPANKAMLREPNDVCLDGKGGLLIADVQDQRIRRVDLQTGLISTFAGTGEKSRAGDGKRAIDASLMGPRAVCMDRLGNTYICEREGNGVRKVDARGILSTIAGAEAVRGYTGDRGPALAATWGAPKAMRCDPQNNIIVVDSENNAVRRIDARTGIVTTIAGGHAGDDGDGGPATAAGLARPHGCGIDAAGNLYIADTHNHRVRVVGL